MNLMEQFAAEKKAADELLAKGENLNENEIAELKSHYENAKGLQDRIKLFEGVNDLNVNEQEVTPRMEKSLGSFYYESAQKAGFTVDDLRYKGFATPEFKMTSATDPVATGGAPAAPTGYGPMLQQIDREPVWPVRRELRIADLMPVTTLTGEKNSVAYPSYAAAEGAPTVVAEGGAKPSMTLAAPTWTTDELKKLAVYWKETDEMLEDLGYMTAQINRYASDEIRLVEEDQLLKGTGTNGNIKGLLKRSIQTIGQGSDSDLDRIRTAKRLIKTATNHEADAIVINPADLEKFDILKDANGQYLSGGVFGSAYGNAMPAQQYLWRTLRIVETTAIDEGTVLVGAFNYGASVLRKGGMRVESTNSHDVDFTKNLVTFRIEERVGLQVKYPKAFTAVTLGLKTETK